MKILKVLVLVIIYVNGLGYLRSSENKYIKSYFGSILAGQIANYANDNVKAVEFFTFANKKEPKNIEIYNLSLMALILDGKVDIAIQKVRKFQHDIKYKSELSDLLLLIGFIKEEKNIEAMNFLNVNKNILISDKIKPILKSWLSKNYSDSIDLLDNFEYKNEGLALSKLYYLNLALIANYYDKKKEAYEAFDISLKNFSLAKLRILYFYAIFLKENPQFEDKNGHINKFIENNKDHSFSIYLKKINSNYQIKGNSKLGIAETFFSLSESLYNQGLYDTSIAFCQIALFLDSRNLMCKYLIAQSYESLGKKNKAIEYIKKVKLESYIGWNSYLKLSNLYISQKKYDEAQNTLNKLVNYQSNRIDVYYKLGELHHNKKDYLKAIEFFSRSISLLKEKNKKDWYLYYSRGMSYERSNKWKEAESDFLYALDLSPDQPLVLNYLGYSWIDFGKNIEKALKLIKKAVKLRPNDGYFIDSLGWAYYRQGNYKRAVEELEKAVVFVPNDPIINDHLGDALWRAGYQNEASFQWKRALLYKPDDELKANIRYKLDKGL